MIIYIIMMIIGLPGVLPERPEASAKYVALPLLCKNNKYYTHIRVGHYVCMYVYIYIYTYIHIMYIYTHMYVCSAKTTSKPTIQVNLCFQQKLCESFAVAHMLLTSASRLARPRTHERKYQCTSIIQIHGARF